MREGQLAWEQVVQSYPRVKAVGSLLSMHFSATLISFSFSVCGLCVHVQPGIEGGCIPLSLHTLVLDAGSLTKPRGH